MVVVVGNVIELAADTDIVVLGRVIIRVVVTTVVDSSVEPEEGRTLKLELDEELDDSERVEVTNVVEIDVSVTISA